MYTSIGKTNREPTRNDMFGGNDNIDPWNQTQIGDLKKVKPESVTDFELGTKIKNERGFLQVNYYFMQFKNEITPIGALSYIGLPLRKNVASSYRTGIEIDWMYKLLHNLSINQNATWSNNKIKTYMNDVDSVTYNNVSPLLTPELIVNHSIQYSPVSKFTISLSGRYASKAYLDNTSNNNFTTPAYYINDLKLNYQPTSYLNISGWINNLTDEKYFTAGNIAGTEAAYFAMAGINYMVCLSLKY
jgi:iron complex outermembrane receptor protein